MLMVRSYYFLLNKSKKTPSISDIFPNFSHFSKPPFPGTAAFIVMATLQTALLDHIGFTGFFFLGGACSFASFLIAASIHLTDYGRISRVDGVTLDKNDEKHTDKMI